MVHPSCPYASNPFHVCVEVCFQIIPAKDKANKLRPNQNERSSIIFHAGSTLSHTFNKFGGLRYLGRFEFCFSPGKYSPFFRLHLDRAFKHHGRRVCSPEDVHGWDIKPVRFQPSTSDGQTDQSKYYLEDPGSWINYLVGDFLVADADELVKVKFSMTQIDCTHTKGCLCVDPVLIYPKDLRLGKVPPFYI